MNRSVVHENPAGPVASQGAEAAVLAQGVEVLDQDGERQLRDVGGVLPGEPVVQRDGEHEALVFLQHGSPRAAGSPATGPYEVSVRSAHGPPVTMVR